MQPAVEHSPWPRRIMITGLVLGFIGVIGFSVIFDDFREYYDPREMSEYTVDSDSETNTVLNLSSGCWVVNVEGDDSDYDVAFQYVENGAAAGEVSEDCRSDFQASSGDADFSKITTLDIEKTSQVLVIIDCEEEDGCDKTRYISQIQKMYCLRWPETLDYGLYLVRVVLEDFSSHLAGYLFQSTKAKIPKSNLPSNRWSQQWTRWKEK